MEFPNNAAYIIKKFNQIWDKKPGKKILQKLVFLIQEAGVDLGFDYGLHFYGPYSSSLDAVTTFLSADGIIDFDYSGYSHLMSVNEEVFSVQPMDLSREQLQLIDRVITDFGGRSASDLELLATALYAYKHLQDKSRESIIQGVIKIKGAKYSREQIETALNDFSYFGKPRCA